MEKQGERLERFYGKIREQKPGKILPIQSKKIELKNHICGPIKMNIIKLSKRLQVTSYEIFKTSVFWVNQSDKSHQK
jgi:hypothetical protein